MGVEQYNANEQQDKQHEQQEGQKKHGLRLPKRMQKVFQIEDEHKAEDKEALIAETHEEAVQLDKEVDRDERAPEPIIESAPAPVESAPEPIRLPASFDTYLNTPRTALAARYNLTLPTLDMKGPAAKTVLVDKVPYTVVNKGSAYTGEKGYTSLNGQGGVGDMYFGDFKNGVPEGKGKIVYKDGSVCEGTFKNGLLDGQGMMHKVILWPDPKNPSQYLMATYEYIGDFVQGKREGVGYYKWPDGQTLLCNWENNRPAPTTLAKMVYPAEEGKNFGDTYEGNLKTITDPENPKKWQVIREGQGTYTYADGKPSVTGQWHNGDPTNS